MNYVGKAGTRASKVATMWILKLAEPQEIF